ncbi:MAG TPA: hypothetical protein PKE58_08080 [Acidobacteriota bacterium]|nr:hypothetical protein [Acidobacteriota bacterium]
MNSQEGNTGISQSEEFQLQVNWRIQGSLLIVLAIFCLGVGGFAFFKAWEHSSTGTQVTDGWTWRNALLLNAIFLCAVGAVIWETYWLSNLSIDAWEITKPAFFGGTHALPWSELTSLQSSSKDVVNLSFGQRKLRIAPHVFQEPEKVKSAIYHFANQGLLTVEQFHPLIPRPTFQIYRFSELTRRWLVIGGISSFGLSIVSGIMLAGYRRPLPPDVAYVLGFAVLSFSLFLILPKLGQLTRCSFQIDQTQITKQTGLNNRFSIQWQEIELIETGPEVKHLLLKSKQTQDLMVIEPQTENFKVLKNIIQYRTNQLAPQTQPPKKKKRPRR